MPTDPTKLKPTEACELLNSTDLGTVLTTARLRAHRTRAGRRIGTDGRVHLVAYAAWLAHNRHHGSERSSDPDIGNANQELAEFAAGGAAVAARSPQMRGHGEKLSRLQEVAIAALLSEPTHAEAASVAGVDPSTLYRWLAIPEFRDAYRAARREIVDGAVGSLQVASGLAVQALVAVATKGRRDSDRVRAADAILKHAIKGLADADVLWPRDRSGDSRAPALDPTEVVRVLSAQLLEIGSADLSTAERTKLAVALSQALLKALAVETLDQRLAALEAVLKDRE